MRSLGRAHRSQKQRRPEPPQVCARQGLRPGRKDSGHLNQPREVVSTPWMMPVCAKARTGALLWEQLAVPRTIRIRLRPLCRAYRRENAIDPLPRGTGAVEQVQLEARVLLGR